MGLIEKLRTVSVVLTIIASMLIIGLVLPSLINISGVPYLSGFATQSTDQIIMTESVGDELEQRWNDNERTGGLEYAYCLDTTIRDGTTVIESVREVEYIQRSRDSISYRANDCREGLLHTHPNGNCGMSDQDYYTMGKADLEMSVIQCGEDRFKAYTPDNLEGVGISPQ